MNSVCKIMSIMNQHPADFPTHLLPFSSLFSSGMQVNTSNQHQALPRLPRTKNRKLYVEATPTPPHSASIASMAQRVKGRNAVNHDHRTVPDTLAGM